MARTTARNIKLISHIVPHNDFINNVIDGKIQGRKPRKKHYEVLQDLTNCRSYREMKDVAKDRDEWLHGQSLTFRILEYDDDDDDEMDHGWCAGERRRAYDSL